MSKGYAIYLGKDNRKLKVLEFTIQQYPKSQQLMQFMNEHQNSTITGADLKAAGFEDITKDLMYPIRPMGKSGRGSLADDAQIVLNDNGIQTILQRILAYNNYKASEKIDKNRLVSIEYNEQWYKSTVERIEKCIQHFYQLADDLWSAFAEVPGISFEIGEEEAQYANLYFRVLYKGRFFIQLLGKFGGATFLHIISSKQRFPQWEITVHPFEETCQLHGTFKDVHVNKATNEKVLEKVTSSYNDRFEQYSVVQKQFKDIFNTDLDESDFEYDLVRECVMLHEEAERKIVEELLPKPIGEDVKEFVKYTTLDTFTKIFQNGTIRMNSVVAMNDTSETNILQDAIRNFKEPIESEADAYLESNTIKYDFYKSEDEYRYLVVQEKGEQWTVNTDYNLVAPYIDRSLCIGNVDKKNAHKYNFAFVLRRAILGPAMTNQKYNVWQLNYIASRKNLWNFKVESSKIDNFR